MSGSFVIATWNVLHRVHAVNWEEPAIAAHPDEDVRIAAISERIARLAPPPAVFCLQEVSGDQLAALRRTQSGTILATKYPRVPRYRRRADVPPIASDPAEYLVTIVGGHANAKLARATAFPTDPGKGFQIVELAELAVVNTHVSYGGHHAAQCRQLVSELGSRRGTVVIVGDFNADRAACSAQLSGFSAGVPIESGLATRPRATPNGRSESIDHVFVRAGSILDMTVASGNGLSDHNPVIARIELRVG